MILNAIPLTVKSLLSVDFKPSILNISPTIDKRKKKKRNPKMLIHKPIFAFVSGSLSLKLVVLIALGKFSVVILLSRLCASIISTSGKTNTLCVDWALH